MFETKIEPIYKRWNDINNIISEEAAFDVDVFNSLFVDTKSILAKEYRALDRNDDGEMCVMFTASEVALLLELWRFYYKEVINEEQLQAQEQVYEFVDELVYGLPVFPQF